MKRPHHVVGLESTIPTELLPPTRRRTHAAPRRRQHAGLWATGGTIVVGLGLFITASLCFAPPTGATNATEDAHEAEDLGLAEEFIVTSDDEARPAESEAPVSAGRTTPQAASEPESSPISQAPSQRLPDDDPESLVENPATQSPLQHEDPNLLAPDISEPATTLDQEINRLSRLPPASLRFNEEPLEIAIAMIADSAGMSYATNGVLEGKVTGSLVGNPYRLLRNLSKAYAFEMDYHNGLWTFSSSTKPVTRQRQPIITRSYEITNNMLERLKMRETSSLGGAGGAGGASGFGGSSGRGGSSSGGSQLTSANMLAGHTVFEADYTRMVEDLQLLLQASKSGQDDYQASVFLNEDGNSLLVAGSEEDHRLIKAYLDNFDKPQRAVALEVKLIRTKRNPSSLIGVDWSSGISFDLSGTFDEGKVSLDRVIGGLGGAPTGVLITNSEARVTLDAIKNDSLTKRISYIEKMTLDNREVVLSNVVEEPVIGNREEVDSQAGLRVLLSIEKEIIGTVINILPRIMRDDTIKMRLRLEDSNIVRFKQFFEDSSGGEYPVISKQTYEGPVVIKDGYSLAITGFETTEEVQSRSRVPILGDIPLVGKAFGRERSQEERSYLVIFITPRILQDSTSGLDYLNRGHHLGRTEPLGPIAGTHFESFRDLERYVSGIRRQHDDLMQMADVRGVSGEQIAEARFLYTELEALAGQLQTFAARGVEPRKTAAMLDFCDTAISNTWRVLQQEPPPHFTSPAAVVHDPSLRDPSVYRARKAAFKAEAREESRSSIFDRFRSRRKGG